MDIRIVWSNNTKAVDAPKLMQVYSEDEFIDELEKLEAIALAAEEIPGLHVKAHHGHEEVLQSNWVLRKHPESVQKRLDRMWEREDWMWHYAWEVAK